MAFSMFESVTRVAIEEIIAKHSEESKFGYILSKDALKELTDDFFDLLMTSRNLKSAGDRFLQLKQAEDMRRNGARQKPMK